MSLDTSSWDRAPRLLQCGYWVHWCAIELVGIDRPKAPYFSRSPQNNSLLPASSSICHSGANWRHSIQLLYILMRSILWELQLVITLSRLVMVVRPRHSYLGVRVSSLCWRGLWFFLRWPRWDLACPGFWIGCGKDCFRRCSFLMS